MKRGLTFLALSFVACTVSAQGTRIYFVEGDRGGNSEVYGAAANSLSEAVQIIGPIFQYGTTREFVTEPSVCTSGKTWGAAIRVRQQDTMFGKIYGFGAACNFPNAAEAARAAFQQCSRRLSGCRPRADGFVEVDVFQNDGSVGKVHQLPTSQSCLIEHRNGNPNFGQFVKINGGPCGYNRPDK